MEEEILKTLLMKATGYTRDEVSEEYSVSDDGGMELVKRKITTKYYPPDNTALKDYLSLCASKDAKEFTDEELEKEKLRLLNELAAFQKTKHKEDI